MEPSPNHEEHQQHKNNNLPDWQTYFPQPAQLEYASYQALWKYDKVRNEFEKCAKEHLNSDEIRRKIYREGLDRTIFFKELEDVVQPVYQSEKNCGFQNWVYTGEPSK